MQEKSLGDHIIIVNKISKTFPNGVSALQDFSSKIRRSEVVVVIGPSVLANPLCFDASTDSKRSIVVPSSLTASPSMTTRVTAWP